MRSTWYLCCAYNRGNRIQRLGEERRVSQLFQSSPAWDAIPAVGHCPSFLSTENVLWVLSRKYLKYGKDYP